MPRSFRRLSTSRYNRLLARRFLQHAICSESTPSSVFSTPVGIIFYRATAGILRTIVILFVSDMHFGREATAAERLHENALIDCLRSYESKIEHLFLLGDVFDQYIEYKHLVPKGFIRFQALLASWTDRGIPVTYVTGNHDPWHQNYFTEEMGVRLAFEAFAEPLYGKNVYLNHGDGIASRFPLYRWIKHMLLHPVPVNLYRALLPGDSGFRLARWVNRRIHTDVINDEVVRQLRTYALALLEEDSYDVVVMGHSHCAEHIERPFGTYLNTGCWRLHRTYACMQENAVQLFQWDDALASARPFELEALPI